MMKNPINFKWLIFLFLCISFRSWSQNEPYKWYNEVELLKRIDKLPLYRTGNIVEQISSYDRTGGNDDGFSGKYSFLRKEKENLVLADLKGPGVINRIWTPTPTEDTLLFYFDGEDVPRLKIKFSDLFSGKVYPFLKPVCGNEVGGYYCYVPFPYRNSCKIVFEGEKIMFHQIQYRNLPDMNVETYSGNFTENDISLLKEVCDLWSDTSPEITHYTFGLSSDIRTYKKTGILHPGEEITFYESDIAGRVVGFEIDCGNSFEGIYKDVILSATWDDEQIEAIYAPVTDFFGYAYGKSAMRSILLGKNKSFHYCYFPMPYDRSAKMKLIYKKRDEIEQYPISLKIKTYFNNNKRDIANEGKFYSVWQRRIPPRGKYYEFLNIEGKGHYVGTIHQAQGLRSGMTLFFEGDDSTYVDGEMRIHGTGSEDYYNGGWYALLDRWDRGNSLPIHGCLDYSLPMNRTGGYRFFLSDKLSFEQEIFHGIEHGPEQNEFPVDYTSLAFFYGAQPLKNRMEPSNELRVVYLPQKHVYFPQLMDLTLGGGVKVVHDRGICMITESEGMVRIMLNDVPEGHYKVFISYFEKPNGACFSVWQRQKQLTDWESSWSKSGTYREKIPIGDIELNSQTNSITFHIREKDKRTEFELDRILLERQ
jgi:hypothetical protein